MARVPILKFKFNSRPILDCDLSMSQVRESFETTKLMWTYSRLDERVAPLVFIARYWARLTNITDRVRPTTRFTNFQITLLVINYLVWGVQPRILPPLGEIAKLVELPDNVVAQRNRHDENYTAINCVHIDLNHFK